MCEVKKGLMFCTCSNNEKANDQEYTWELIRQERSNSIIMGSIRFDEKLVNEFNESLSTENLLELLNSRDCFDFNYVPKSSDVIRVFSSKNRNEFLAIKFENNHWEGTSVWFPGFQEKTIKSGTLDLIGEKTKNENSISAIIGLDKVIQEKVRIDFAKIFESKYEIECMNLFDSCEFSLGFLGNYPNRFPELKISDEDCEDEFNFGFYCQLKNKSHSEKIEYERFKIISAKFRIKDIILVKDWGKVRNKFKEEVPLFFSNVYERKLLLSHLNVDTETNKLGVLSGHYFNINGQKYYECLVLTDGFRKFDGILTHISIQELNIVPGCLISLSIRNLKIVVEDISTKFRVIFEELSRLEINQDNQVSTRFDDEDYNSNIYLDFDEPLMCEACIDAGCCLGISSSCPF